MKASTKESRSGTKRPSMSTPTAPASPTSTDVKPKKRIQVVFSPPFSLKVIQVVRGGESNGKSSKVAAVTSTGKTGAAQHSPNRKTGGSSSSPNNNSSNGSGHINNATNKNCESEVPKSGQAGVGGAVVAGANSNIASVRNDLSASSSNQQKSNGASESKISQSKSIDNIAPQKISNKSVNNQHHKSHKSSRGKELAKSKSSSSILGANKNITDESCKKGSDTKIIENLEVKIDKDKVEQKVSGKGTDANDGGGGGASSNNKDNHKNASSNNSIKGKVKASGSFLQRRKQNLVKGSRSGEKSELRVLIPPANLDDDDINSPVTPMS